MIGRMRYHALLPVLVVLGACARPQPAMVTAQELPPLLPIPAHFTQGRGEWRPSERVVAILADPATADHGELSRLGVQLAVRPGGPAESYTLDVAPRAVSIVAADSAGLFYGLQTLRQLVEAGPAVRAIHVEDAPRFRYRGLHLDVVRHFMPVDFVERYIDLMARQKLNTFHWHLTDDQGWRIEIAKYPRLTAVGGCRTETQLERNRDPYVGDGIRHCGFYTQREIRDVIAYARARHVTVIPEIEMPGHAKAALAAYPELACTPGPFAVRTTWGVEEDVFCPSERTFEFIDDVLGEVTALFPSRYVHIGGDEVPRRRWTESALAQEIIRREGLKNEAELQSWFIRRVERMLTARGRRLIGWDEILEGGLAPEATVMSWRGSAGGIAAAREGHDVVMTPNSHLYLDYYQADPAVEPPANCCLVTLRRVYDFDPVPDSLTPEQARHILGAQGNVWTEFMKTPERVEYMVYPRALALAEMTWSPQASRSWESFTARLPHALRSLDRLRVNHRLPDVEGLEGDRITLQSSARVRLSTAMPDGEIRYTTDGSDPTRASALYREPIELAVDTIGTRLTARAFAPDGRASAPRSSQYARASLRGAAKVDAARLAPGLRYQYYEATLRSTRALDTLRPMRSGVVSVPARRGDERAEQYGLVLSGYLVIPADGVYDFALVSDDGSTFHVGDRLVIDHDGFHGADEKTGAIALARGAHPITLRYIQATGGAALALRYRVGDAPWAEIPRDWLVHTP